MINFDFDKISMLSHLVFSEDEQQSFIKDMHEMLSLADSLCTLDKEETPKMLHENVIPLDKDEEKKSDCPELIKLSKRNDGVFITVPSSLE